MSNSEFPLTKKKLYKFLTKQYIERKENAEKLNHVIFSCLTSLFTQQL